MIGEESRVFAFVAFDMGPTGRLLKPLGDMVFEDAVLIFAANVRIAAKCGADLNVGPCNCREEIDPRLAVLGQLLENE